MTRARSVLLVVSFCALLVAPGLSMALWPGPQLLPKVPEVPYPPFEASSAWAPAFDKYFGANFGLKRRLVQLHNALSYSVLGDLRSDDVLVGRDGWLFLKQSWGWESYRSEQPLGELAAAEWCSTLSTAKRLLAERNIPLLYVMVPSKETIYPEYLPRGATRARSVTRYDEILPVLRAAGIEPLDLREPLMNAKGSQLLYDRLDSHWNGRGAEIGARLVLERVAALLGRPRQYAQIQASLVPAESPKDLASMLALDEYLSEQTVALVPLQRRARRLDVKSGAKPKARYSGRMLFEVPDPSLPRAVILRDSFSLALMEPLAEKFRRSLWLRTRDLDLRWLEKEKPDIVIIQVTERFYHAEPPKLQLPRSAEHGGPAR